MITWKVYCTGIVFAGNISGIDYMYDTRDFKIRHKKRDPKWTNQNFHEFQPSFFVGALTLDSMGAFDWVFFCVRYKRISMKQWVTTSNGLSFLALWSGLMKSHWFPLIFGRKLNPDFLGGCVDGRGVGWRPPWCHVWREILVSKSIRTESIDWNLMGSLQCHTPQEIIRPY